MIPIVTLKGGLGNQLFQWFYAHSLNQLRFRLTTHSYQEKRSGPVRDLQVNQISYECPHFQNPGKGEFQNYRRDEIAMRVLARGWESIHLRKKVERLGYVRDDSRYDVPSTTSYPKQIRFSDGYFQNNAFIDSVWDHVDKELIPFISSHFQKVTTRLSIPDAYVAIHVRRSDRIELLKLKAHIGIMSNDYFINAIENIPTTKSILMIENEEDCGSLIEILKPDMILDSKSTSAWDTLAIMAHAKNLIGSNSSLSWWGAKLAVKAGNRACLPDSWSQHNNVDMNKLKFPGLDLVSATWFDPQSPKYI